MFPSRAPQFRHVVRIGAAAALINLLAAGAAGAQVITETLNFTLSGFVDITGSIAPPIPTITGSITINYDPTLTYDNDTTDITVNSLSGISVGSPLGFTYQGGYLEFGGIQNDADLVFSNTNDLVVAFNVTNPAAPTFVPCSTPGYTCGNYTGSPLVDAAGYTQVGYNTGWFYGVPQSTVSSAPEPASIVLFGIGLAFAGLVHQRRLKRSTG